VIDFTEFVMAFLKALAIVAVIVFGGGELLKYIVESGIWARYLHLFQ
jgi:L-asparagine transporter-like permease